MNVGATLQQPAEVSTEAFAGSDLLPRPTKKERHAKKRGEKSMPKSYGSETILVGFDTEFVNHDETTNRLVSYQFHACDGQGKNEWPGIVYPASGDKADRISFPKFFKRIITDGLSQSKIRRWPKRIILIGHFTLADLTGFEDFDDYKTEFDAIRRTFTTIGKETTVTICDDQRHVHKIKVVLRDSMLLAPEGSKSLKTIGDLVGVPKVELREGEIERMDLLLESDPARFEEYALQDPKIPARYALRIMALNRELFDEDSIPPTLSTIGVKLLLKFWEQEGLNQHRVLGTELVTEKVWSRGKPQCHTRKKTVPLAIRNDHESLATESYHGGRGEQYFFGPSEEGIWSDYDLSGAYPTAMALIGLPQWDKLHPSTNVDDYQLDVLGYARIKFKFPKGTRFPCIPVRTEFGLIFPLGADETYCCAPEIDLARAMGAEVEILHGVILPTDPTIRPFESFIIDCTERRKSYVKKTLEELFWKELSNGTYGKTAQGLLLKRRFDTRSGDYDLMPPSKITNPFIAAFVTSFIRAAVGEILSKLPASALVSNVTTDGLLTTATSEEMKVATSGPICQQFAEERGRIVGQAGVTEMKHQVGQVLGMRTRGQATLAPIPGQAIVLAKAGLKPPDHLKDENDKNKWVVELFQKRNQNTTLVLSLLRTLPEIHKKGGDLVQKTMIRKVSLEYDFKRRPVDATERSIKGVPHLYFDTTPWQNAEEFVACRHDWDLYKNIQGGVLKTKAELDGFLDYRSVQAIPGLRRPGKDTSLKIARRMFLRAYVRSTWGLDATTMSYSDLAAWLSRLGYHTKKSDVENANRSWAKLVPHTIFKIPAVENFIARVKEKFPSFQEEMLVKVSDNIGEHPNQPPL